MMLREMATTYGKSSMGYLWAVLEPIGAVAVLSIAFSIALQNPALGNSFPLFYATGYLPFMFYNTMQNSVGATLRENIQLLFYPRVTYMDAIFSRFLLVTITQFLVAFIVFYGIIILDSVNQRLDLMAIVGSLMVAAFLGLGVGVLNCVIIHLMPSWRQMWSIITRPIFLISCIFYLFDSLPTWVQTILWFNPLVHIIGYTRTGFYSLYKADYVVLAYPLAIGGVTLFIGLALLRRHARDLINS
jgi:capsular polysaccharide transport system permease protein